MLQELVNIQKEGGMEMEVCFTGDNVYVKKKIIFSVAFVMGDCKGNDNLAGKYASHAKGVRRISRACNCRSQDADQTNFQCEFVTKNQVQQAIADNNLDALKEISQHNVVNAFHKVCFGGDKYNIHGCTPLDVVVHVNQLGMYKYTMKVFFQLLKTTAACTFDNYVKKFYSLPQQRAAHGLPRTDYGSGISNIAGLTAAEYSGCIFVMGLILMTDDGQSLCNKVFGTSANKNKHTMANCYLHLFEMMMCYEQWAKKKEYWVIGDEEATGLAELAITKFLDSVKEIADRTEGYQWKITKFHEQLHVVWYMKRFGSPRNFDAGMGEKNHKVLAKWPAATAQKRYMTFDLQSMERLHELYILNRAQEEFLAGGHLPSGFLGLDGDQEAETSDGETDSRTQDETSGGSTFILKRKNGELALYWPTKKMYLPNVLPELLDDLLGRYFVCQPDHTYRARYQNFTIHSEYTNMSSTVYRAHPLFRDRAWYDWVTIRWGLGSGRRMTMTPPIPARVMLLVSYTNENQQLHEAIIWSAAANPKRATVLGSTFRLEENTRKKPKLRSVSAEQLGPHCFCFPNFGSTNREHFMVDSKHEWSGHFCSV
jgi:hypothetical protein